MNKFTVGFVSALCFSFIIYAMFLENKDLIEFGMFLCLSFYLFIIIKETVKLM